MLLCPFLPSCFFVPRPRSCFSGSVHSLVGPQFHNAGMMCSFSSEYLVEFTPYIISYEAIWNPLKTSVSHVRIERFYFILFWRMQNSRQVFRPCLYLVWFGDIYEHTFTISEATAHFWASTSYWIYSSSVGIRTCETILLVKVVIWETQMHVPRNVETEAAIVGQLRLIFFKTLNGFAIWPIPGERGV